MRERAVPHGAHAPGEVHEVQRVRPVPRRVPAPGEGAAGEGRFWKIEMYLSAFWGVRREGREVSGSEW